MKAYHLLIILLIGLIARPDGVRHHPTARIIIPVGPPMTVTNVWQTFTNCTLLPNRSNDGDSFHVLVAGFDRTFRLLGVDTLETDWRYPARDLDQAAHFGIGTNLVVQFGRLAQATTALRLAKPFTVYTKWRDALGNGRQPRYQAWVVLDDGQNLSNVLIEQGLACVHGFFDDSPSGIFADVVRQHFTDLEQQAATNRVGIWGAR